MTPFDIVVSRAKAGQLPDGADSAYYSSEAFRVRLEFQGEQSIQDLLRMTLYMLQQVALDPREVYYRDAQMEMGIVSLDFFGVTNPIPSFDLAPDSPELQTLRSAVKVNEGSRMYRAAQRVLKWREPSVGFRRHRHEEASHARIRARQTWPTREDHATDRSRAEELVRANVTELALALNVLRDRRNGRLALMVQASAPGVGSYSDFVESLALSALPPHKALVH